MPFCMRHSRKQLKMSKICAFSPILTKKGCFCISASMTRSNKKISLAKSACFCVLQSLLGEISNREHAFAFQLTLMSIWHLILYILLIGSIYNIVCANSYVDHL